MSDSEADELCILLKETYNTYWINEYPELKESFIEVRDLYETAPEKFPYANKTFLSLVYNLYNQENIPNVDYITGPGEISKWEHPKLNKIIYLFGENDHSNLTGCLDASKKKKINLYGKKHIKIETYLLQLFEHSPVFIDFYVEFGVMLNKKETISTTSGQTLWDMLSKMKGCFGPINQRNCPYNVRMHGTDARTVLSDKYTTSTLAKLDKVLMMQNILLKKNSSYISLKDFKKIFRKEIDILSLVKTNDDLIKIMTIIIDSNELYMKEISRSTLSYNQLIDFFIKKELYNSLSEIPYCSIIIGKWFKALKKLKTWPDGIEYVSNILTMVNAVVMDIYTAARIFKVFNVKENEHFPQEPQNIIYYAGTGHTKPMGRFLKRIGFKMTENSDDNILSCVSMKGIKQPLFS